MQHLKVSQLRLVSGLGEYFEAGLHQGSGAAAKHGLLAEQVGLGLLREGRFKHTSARAADAFGVA